MFLAHHNAVRPPGYAGKIRSLFKARPIVQYLPLWDAALAPLPRDISGKQQHATGVSDAPTTGATGIGDGRTAFSFDGTNDSIDVYTPRLLARFPGAEGWCHFWIKAADAGTWTGIRRDPFIFFFDASNFIGLQKVATTGVLTLSYVAGGVSKTVSSAGQSALTWLPVCCSWSKPADELKLWVNQTLAGTATGLGIWAMPATPSTSQSLLGEFSSSHSRVWKGSIAHWLLVSGRAPSTADLLALATVP